MTDIGGMPDLDAALEAELLRLTHHTPNGGRQARETRVVIFAGGRGARLEPYTSVLPKPLMPIGHRAILEILVTQLADAGFRHLTFCVGYLSHLIRAVFENGPSSRVDITWVKEAEPLGTAGPLRLVEGLDKTFVAMNGDLLTTLDIGALLEHHRESGNALTIATHPRSVRSDYGVLHFGSGSDSRRVVAYEEKPETIWHVSMGVYVLEPSALEMIPATGAFDFPDLVQELLDADRRVGAFVHDGLWLDIGRHEDYENAVELWKHGSRLAEVVEAEREMTERASTTGTSSP
jgi:NDP-sugar pyrophosphorylase family protein